MAAPVDSYIALVDDTSALGAKGRSQSRVVGADTAHEHYALDADLISGRVDSRMYAMSGGVQTCVVGPHTALQGYLWVLNPLTSGTAVVVRTVTLTTVCTGIALVSTRLNLELVTFLGQCTGAQIAPVVMDTTKPAATTEFRTASTGLTLSSVNNNAAVFSFWLGMLINTTGGNNDIMIPLQMKAGNQTPPGGLFLRPGEGMVVRQPDVGTVLQRFVFNMTWEEFSLLV